MKPLDSRRGLCDDAEVGGVLWAVKRSPELVDEPADIVVVVPGVVTAASSKEVCNGAGRGRGVRLFLRDE